MTNNMLINDDNMDIWNDKNGNIVGYGDNFEFSITEYENICETHLLFNFVTVDGYKYKFCSKVQSIEKIEN